MDYYMDIINSNVEYILLGLAGVIILSFIIILIQSVKISKLNKKYNNFLVGKDAKSLEDIITTRLAEVDELKAEYLAMKQEVGNVSDSLQSSYQKMAIVKYDAFKEMGGKLSFALCLLNDQNTGFVLNSMHSTREGCYTYVKEIINGESFVVLAEEEKEALMNAMNVKNYMQ